MAQLFCHQRTLLNTLFIMPIDLSLDDNMIIKKIFLAIELAKINTNQKW